MPKCTNPKCSSGLEGRWQPVLLMWPEGYLPMQCQPVSVTFNDHMVCDHCKQTLTAQTFVSPKEFEAFQVTVAGHGKNRPSVKTAKLEFFVEDSFGKGFAGEIKHAKLG